MRFISKRSGINITFRLRTKFLICIILLECLIMSGTIVVVDRQMRKSASDQFLKLGIAISKNLSAVNASFVTTYNYVGIEQNVAKAVSDNGLTYALIQFFDGELAAYSGEEMIRSEVVQNAIESQAVNSFKNQDKLYDLILETALLATEAYMGLH